MTRIAAWVLKAAGWKVDEFRPSEKKYVLIVAPHTSVWDFVVGRLAFWTKKMPARFLIKKEFFVFPFGGLLKALGGLPIDRKQAGNVVEHAAALIHKADELALILTPEGTRKRTEHWKRGFYYIAKRANVPLYAGIVDYEKKVCKILPQTLDTNKDFNALMEDLAKIYRGAKGKYPENFNF